MPKIVDHDERRAEFVAAACRVLAQEGLAGATLRRIAAEAGATTGALTHYFPDRDDLLRAALRDAHHQAAERMLRAARALTDPRARLLALLREALPLDRQRLQEWRVWLAFWAAAAGNPALAAENRRRYAQWQDAIETLAAPLCATPADARQAATLLVAIVDGFGLQLALPGADRAALAAARTAAETTLQATCATLGRA